MRKEPIPRLFITLSHQTLCFGGIFRWVEMGSPTSPSFSPLGLKLRKKSQRRYKYHGYTHQICEDESEGGRNEGDRRTKEGCSRVLLGGFFSIKSPLSLPLFSGRKKREERNLMHGCH